MVLSVMGIGRCIILSMFREKRNVASIFEENSTGKEKEWIDDRVVGRREGDDCLIDRSCSNRRWGYIHYVISGYTWSTSHRLYSSIFIPVNELTIVVDSGKIFVTFDGWRDGLWFIFRINEIKGRNKGKILSMVISSFNFIHKNLTVFRSWPCFTR